ncbi:FtsX-like permease family protein [Clostridium niameyense]|uniref:FtsX-like permease family protein n=1 Tax=Clostridium niameyense TaxID=1622073 RepID=A0A6M0R877_9CLOT|nr:FtsX-like permease family protein [Clostridium niameyense]NEZ46433.1 FtsX-like permease family protein [Clostridium niameyense]
MKILLKFMFKNIKEKKLRSLLIIISVMVSTAMCFASMGISKSYENMVLERMKSKVGDANLVLHKQKDQPSPFIDKEKINNKLKDHKIVYVLDGDGSYKSQDNILKVNIKASDIKELNSINKIVLSEESKRLNFTDIKDNGVVISKSISKKLNLDKGDIFKIKVSKKEIKLKVDAIAINKGFFSESAGEMNIIMDRKGFCRELQMEPSITSALIKVKKENDISNIKKYCEDNFKDCEVTETISKSDLKNTVKQFTIPFYIMLILVMLVASFIIFSAYKVIVVERISVIGTFRSIGATKVSTDIIMLMESLLYGIIGGVLGDILGVPILYYLADSSNMFKQYGVKTVVSIDKMNFLWAFLLAIILCIVSSIIPILRASKIFIKDIILGSFSENKNLGFSKLVIGLVLLIIPYVYINHYRWKGNFLLSILCAFSVFIGMGLVTPYVLKIICFIFKEVFRVLLGNEGAIALDNIAQSKVLTNNGTLLTSIIAAVVVIYIASFSVSGLITNGYKNLNYDFKMEQIKDYKIKDKVESLNYVKDFEQEILLDNIEVKDKNFKIRRLQGIEQDKFLKFYKDVNIYDYNGNDKWTILRKLKDNRNIIISDVLEKKGKLKVSDKINLKLDNKYRQYNIVGFAKSEFISNGQGALISFENLRKDSNKDQGIIRLKCNYQKGLERKLKDDLQDFGIVITTKQQDLKTDLQVNKGLMKSLESFSLMALIIGSLGMMNNLMVSFIYRKREFAVLASIGMSKVQRVKLILIEGFIIGIIGSTLGVLEGLYISEFLGEITYSLDSYIRVYIPLKIILFLGLLGFILVLIASMVPAIKSSKISIVREIKYE